MGLALFLRGDPVLLLPRAVHTDDCVDTRIAHGIVGTASIKSMSLGEKRIKAALYRSADVALAEIVLCS